MEAERKKEDGGRKEEGRKEQAPTPERDRSFVIYSPVHTAGVSRAQREPHAHSSRDAQVQGAAPAPLRLAPGPAGAGCANCQVSAGLSRS